MRATCIAFFLATIKYILISKHDLDVPSIDEGKLEVPESDENVVHDDSDDELSDLDRWDTWNCPKFARMNYCHMDKYKKLCKDTCRVYYLQYTCPSKGQKFRGLDNWRKKCSACWTHPDPVDGCSAGYWKNEADRLFKVSNSNILVRGVWGSVNQITKHERQ